MKELNRRAFLTLTGAALAMVALAACGADDGPVAPPAAPTNGKEAKVLEAINKYRGELPALTLDSGLDPTMEIVVKLAKGEMEFDENAANALGAAYANYNGFCAPIGVRMDNDSPNVTPVCVYSDNAELMAQNLNNQLDESAKASLKSPAIKLVNIKTFEYSGTTYWVALIAESKKVTA